jgi:drug/metabolite transporter (DMT)-like permease
LFDCLIVYLFIYFFYYYFVPSQLHSCSFSSHAVGIFYGSNFTPPEYVMAHCNGTCSQEALDYVYAHFCGIYLTSTFYFLAYCAALTLLKRKIFAPKEIILPAFLSGLMWATAQVLSFIAIGTLGLSIAFPMISILPALVASMWGLFVFKEITGWLNYTLFAVAFAFVIAASLLDAFSK